MFVKSMQDGKTFPEKYFYFNNLSSEIKVNTDMLSDKNLNLLKVNKML